MSFQPHISLIVTTRNRVAELDSLLTSLDAQTYTDLEVVIVDQNPDDRLAAIFRRHPQLNIRHLRSGSGASRGRNVGLHAAAGQILAFPDDDCWYPTDLLANVVSWFEEHPGFDGLFAGLRTPEGKLMAPKFAPGEGACNKTSVLRCALAATVFLRARVTRRVGFFREEMGPGADSPYQSAEDLDYPLRALEHGFRLWNAPQLTVYHPELNSSERLGRVAYGYAMGIGRVWRIHRYPLHLCAADIVFRSLGGAVFNLCRGQLRLCYLYLVRAAGQFHGYVLRPLEMPAAAKHASQDGR